MTDLLTLKEHMKNIYARYGNYIDKLFKFVLTIVIIMSVNRSIGFTDVMQNPLIMIGVALICAFLPMHLIVIVSAGFVLANLYPVSLEIMGVVFLIMLIIFILYLRYVPQEAVVVLLTPLAFVLKIPYVVPLAMGLIGTPLSSISVASGVFMYFIIALMSEYGPIIMSDGADSSAYNMNFIMEQIFQDQQVILTVITFVLVVIAVYMIKRLSIDHAWPIAVGAGALLNILLMLIGDFVFDINGSYVSLFVGTILSAVIALVLQAFIFSVDYSRTERVQFEDDEYYYYVKAVPKTSMVVEDKQVKQINRRTYMNFKRKGADRDAGSGRTDSVKNGSEEDADR